MKELELLLNILNGAQLATPAILAVINSIKSGRAEGKTDEEIQAESMALALETKEITETDMGDQP
jgi:hypothetical protein